MVNWRMIGFIMVTIWIWYCIFTNGFFTTLLGLLIWSVIIGLILRVKEEWKA